jgi:hypothetical protein
VVTVTGSGWEPGSTVDVELHSTPVALGSVVADSSGTISQSFTVPATTELGAHTISLTGTPAGGSSSQTVTVSADLTVAAAAAVVTDPVSDPTQLDSTGTTDTGSTGSSLPVTGTLVGPALALGGFLVLAGAALVTSTRRSRSQD